MLLILNTTCSALQCFYVSEDCVLACCSASRVLINISIFISLKRVQHQVNRLRGCSNPFLCRTDAPLAVAGQVSLPCCPGTILSLDYNKFPSGRVQGRFVGSVTPQTEPAPGLMLLLASGPALVTCLTLAAHCGGSAPFHKVADQAT